MTVPELGFGEAGHGPAIVLLHAFPLNRHMWDEVADGLTGDAYVLAVDMPGFGRSPAPEADTTLEDVADGVVALLDRLGVQRAVVAGLSMGGYVALALAGRHSSRLSGLGLIDTRASADDEAGRQRRLDLADAVSGPAGLRALHGMAETLVSDQTKLMRPQVVAQVEQLIGDATPEGVAWASRAMAARPDTHHVLDALTVPSLVLVGEEDALTPPTEAQKMADRLGVEPVVVPESGHLTALENPDVVTAALLDLIRRSR
jgi:pimeloyl-ACP methyl ester carboxylesterase